MKTLLSTAVVLALSSNLVGAAPNFSAMGEGAMPPPPPHHAPPFEKLLEKFDVNQDGAISQDEVQLVHEQIFTTADTNADGSLTVEELDAYHAQERETHLAEEFAKLDTNGDGGISSEEVSAATTTPGPGHHLARHFTAMDSNADGLVTLDEMKAAMQAREAEMAERHQQMQQHKLARLDNDGDGLISLAEFTANLPLFDHLDANEDGTITAEEAAAQRPQPPADRPQPGKNGKGGGKGQRSARP